VRGEGDMKPAFLNPALHEMNMRWMASFTSSWYVHIYLFIYKEIVHVCGPLWHFVASLYYTMRSCWSSAQHTSWRTTTFRLSVTAYSMYSQLPSSTCTIRTRHVVVIKPSRTDRLWERADSAVLSQRVSEGTHGNLYSRPPCRDSMPGPPERES
jgi:hypothetical protein